MTNAFCGFMGAPRVNRRLMPRFVRSYMKPRNTADTEIMERTIERARTRQGAATCAALWRSFATDAHDLRDRLYDTSPLQRMRVQCILHRRQDPALLEKAAGNQFSAKVFPIPANAEKGAYDISLVLVSYFVASFGSYAGLTLAVELFNARTTKSKRILHWLGAFTLGSCIWSLSTPSMRYRT